MAQRKPIVLHPDGREHQPLAAGDKIETSSIPISGQAYNTIQVMNDGLYVGSAPAPDFASQYVDAVNGNDTDGLGTQASPYKTIARAVRNLVAGVSGYGIYVHVGQTHVLPNAALDRVGVTIAPWGYDGSLLAGIASAWFQKYGNVLTTAALDDVPWGGKPVLVPDKSAVSVQEGIRWGCCQGFRSIGGSVNIQTCRLRLGAKTHSDPAVTRWLRCAMLSDDDLRGLSSASINYCYVEPGDYPLVQQRGAGATFTLNMYGCEMVGNSGTLISGWGAPSAPRIEMSAELPGASTEIEYNGVTYRTMGHTSNTDDLVAVCKNVYYYNGIPLNITGAFLYGRG